MNQSAMLLSVTMSDAQKSSRNESFISPRDQSQFTMSNRDAALGHE